MYLLYFGVIVGCRRRFDRVSLKAINHRMRGGWRAATARRGEGSKHRSRSHVLYRSARYLETCGKDDGYCIPLCLEFRGSRLGELCAQSRCKNSALTSLRVTNNVEGYGDLCMLTYTHSLTLPYVLYFPTSLSTATNHRKTTHKHSSRPATHPSGPSTRGSSLWRSRKQIQEILSIPTFPSR
jgi:hypothetical protein